MLAEKDTINSSPIGVDDDAAKLAGQYTETDAQQRKLRGVPADVRRLAREIAERHGVTLTEFLADAICAHAERLDDAGERPVDAEADPSETAKNYAMKLEELEKRIRDLEEMAKKDSSMARVWMEHYVERPWMRNRGY